MENHTPLVTEGTVADDAARFLFPMHAEEHGFNGTLQAWTTAYVDPVDHESPAGIEEVRVLQLFCL